jgi:hypothetical protein
VPRSSIFTRENITLVTYDRIPSDELVRSTDRFLYHIRHSDDDWDNPITVEPFVGVNHWGSIILLHEIEFASKSDPHITIPKKCRQLLIDMAHEAARRKAFANKRGTVPRI